MIESDTPANPVEVPVEALSVDALNGIIDSFILREGTDYGIQEASYTTRVEQVRRQLSKGDVKVIFDPNSESVTLLTQAQWTAMRSGGLCK